ncbi:Oligopeptide transport ATP-binding protein OppF [Rosistilla carotiformis]|uniref:Oligopeptide transport ATP-binding protein OppF n=1 Tax=Rosistilla carotiformis TaxID=2528017 RepID=A0A518JPI4_9BACT|nr:dipeptide ABC transporter ATP-binding protein [Rosistilla carotiformis]QDV67455.1 Oligopeptide transport ATP-binding protein OppF [Rosistilla carotiformis]
MNDPTAPLLAVEDLKVHFPFRRGTLFAPEHGLIRAVDGVSFEIREGETLGLVGESGCGKSTTARAIARLNEPTSGSIKIEGREICGLSESAMMPFRRTVQMVFQDPFASLNPRMTVGAIISEPLQIHGVLSSNDRKLEVLRLMDLVGLNPRFLNRYPHEFSGGQRQRIGIARALAVRPKLILCDEPVSALDVSIQAQVINLMMDLQQKLGLAYLFIAHDLGIVRHIATRVGVMYLGRIVESANADELYNNPTHPYTRALLSAVPVPDPKIEAERTRTVLTGEVPSPDKTYPGCPFVDRCPDAQSECREIIPRLPDSAHATACIVHDDQCREASQSAAAV